LNVYNYSENEASADEKAFAADIAALKKDFDLALQGFDVK
jgi:hypothetical protein